MQKILILVTSKSELRTAMPIFESLLTQKVEVKLLFCEVFGSANLRRSDIDLKSNQIMKVKVHSNLRHIARRFDKLLILNNRLHLNIWLANLFFKKSNQVYYIHETFLLEHGSFIRLENLRFGLTNIVKAIRLSLFSLINLQISFLFFRVKNMFTKSNIFSGLEPFKNYDLCFVGYNFDMKDERVEVTGLPGIFVDNDYFPSLTDNGFIERILFVSSPLHLDFGISFDSSIQIHREYIRQLLDIFPNSKISIRIHPQDDINLYCHIFDEEFNLLIESQELSPWASISQANLVVGFTSNLLLQSIVLGKPTILFQEIRLNNSGSFLSQFKEFDIPIVKSESELTTEFVQNTVKQNFALTTKVRETLVKSLDGKAAERIAHRILEI